MFDSEKGLNNFVALNNKVVRLRKENRRVLLYRIDPDYHMTEIMGYLPPPVAIFLALLNGRKAELEILNAVKFTFDLSSVEITRRMVRLMVEGLVRNFGPDIFIGSTSPIDITSVKEEYDPLDFIIDAKDVDIKGTRLDVPLDLNFIVTQDCYRRCIYCFAETTQAPPFGLLSVDRFTELMQEACELQINSITN